MVKLDTPPEEPVPGDSKGLAERFLEGVDKAVAVVMEVVLLITRGLSSLLFGDVSLTRLSQDVFAGSIGSASETPTTSGPATFSADPVPAK